MTRSAADLRRTFHSLDHVFFDDHCAQAGVKVRWKKFRPAKNSFMFGEFCGERLEVRINIRLAQPDVPQYVVSCVTYHELLHHVIGLEHDIRFARAEHRHPFYYLSEEWCDAFFEREFAA